MNDAGLDGSAGRGALVVGQALPAREKVSSLTTAETGISIYSTRLVTAALFAIDRPPRQADGQRRLLLRPTCVLSKQTAPMYAGLRRIAYTTDRSS